MYVTGSNDLGAIHNLVKKGYAKNVIEWNKREQIYHDKSMPLPEGSLGGKIEFAIFNDVEAEVYKDITGVEKKYDSDTDGTIYFKPEDMKTMMKSVGLDYIKTKKNKQEGEFNIGLLIPISFAIFITFSLPISSEIFTATVLIDLENASSKVTSPIYSPL